MQIDWLRYIKLMLPIRLRKARLLLALLYCLSKYTMGKYDADRQWTEDLLQDLRYTSQVKVLQVLLDKKFGQGNVKITDSSQSNITLMRENDLEGRRTFIGGSEREKRFFARVRSESNVGEDFVVEVKSGIDKSEVERLIRKYVFYGVGFRVVEVS